MNMEELSEPRVKMIEGSEEGEWNAEERPRIIRSIETLRELHTDLSRDDGQIRIDGNRIIHGNEISYRSCFIGDEMTSV